MKFSFILLLTSNAILATSAAYECTQILPWEGIHDVFENSPYIPTTDTLKLGPMSFPETVSLLDEKVEAKMTETPTHALFLNRKYAIFKDMLVEAAEGTDVRNFLVALHLYGTYESKVNRDWGSLDLLLKDKEEILLTAAEAQGSVLKVEALLLYGKWVASDFPKLMDTAAAEDLSWVVDILLQDDRADEGFTSLTKNIPTGTKLPGLVGPHLLKYAKRKIGTSADDQETANKMWWGAMVPGKRNPLSFLALLDKADATWHEKALAWCQGKHWGDRRFEEAILRAYGKLEGLDRKRRLSNSH